MNKEAYLAEGNVEQFVEWAGQLVRGELLLRHKYREKEGLRFQCDTLHEAFQHYSWRGDSFADVVRKFDGFRRTFDSIGVIDSKHDQRCFISNARAVAKWGGITLKMDDWTEMRPSQLQACTSDIKNRLDPVAADTNGLNGFQYMGSGYSKIYAALIPGLPIYDSRAACALACLVRLYCQGAGLSRVPLLLNLGIPKGRSNDGGRCEKPGISGSQKSKYAKANLQFAWLMQGLVADPGDFAQVSKNRRVDAVQSALFMLGYERLRDDAVVKRG